METAVLIFQTFFIIYFIGLQGSYLLLNAISIFSIHRYMLRMGIDDLLKVYSGYETPVSILVPAYNEEDIIITTVRSLLQLNYPKFEVLVIVDGATDRTLEVLMDEFDLMLFPEAYRIRIETKPVYVFYRSKSFPNLRIICKENGGKADSLNAGINCARYPLFCAVDADSILQQDSLHRVVQPFLNKPDTIAAGGSIRIANGCEVVGGFLVKAGLPLNPLALFQVMEYLRAFLFGRLGWSTFNSLLIISGAFGLFKKRSVIDVGGYRTDAIGEDMELIVRMHRKNRLEGRPYRITAVPDPICWTEAPERLGPLQNQRIRWQVGLAQSLTWNMGLLFNRRGGVPGWVAFPFMIFFEFLGPLIEAAGYAFIFIAFFAGALQLKAFVAFLAVAVGFGLLLSVSAILLEEISFHVYSRPRHILMLFGAAIAENFGYRQINSFWRLVGLIKWALGSDVKWGDMKRKASWQKE